MKIIARKCPFTGKLFDDADQYRKHLIRVRKFNKNRRDVTLGARAADLAIAQARRSIISPDDFLVWFTENWYNLVSRAIASKHITKEWTAPTYRLTSVKWSRDWRYYDTLRSLGEEPVFKPYWVGTLIWEVEVPKNHFNTSHIGADMFEGSVITVSTGSVSKDVHQPNPNTVQYYARYQFAFPVGEWPLLSSWLAITQKARSY